jgi:hypothetical protein
MTALQTMLAAMPAGTAWVSCSTLAQLYALDAANHYAQGTTGNVFLDATGADNGTWAKTGAGTGAGNWTLEVPWTIPGLIANVAMVLRSAPVLAMQWMTLPTVTAIGDRYVLVAPGSGALRGNIVQASTTAGGWVYVQPQDGDEIFLTASQVKLRYYAALQVWGLPQPSPALAELSQYLATTQNAALRAFAHTDARVFARFDLDQYRLDGGPSSLADVAAIARASCTAFWSRDENGAACFVENANTVPRKSATRGQACERASTNFMANPTFAGGVVGVMGSGGVLPTGYQNWVAGGNGLTINAITTADGYETFDFTLTRGTSNASQLFLGMGPFGNAAPAVTQARGGIVFSHASDVLDNTGITYCKTFMTEFDGGGTQVGLSYDNGFFYTAGALVKRSCWRAIPTGHKFMPGIFVQLPDTVTAFSLRMQISRPIGEDGDGPGDYTTWIPGAQTRNAETLSLILPTWAAALNHDILVQGENGGQWLLNQAPVAGELVIPAQTHASGVIGAIAFPAGYLSSFDAYNAMAEAIFTPKYAVPTPGVFGGVMRQLPNFPSTPALYIEPLVSVGDIGNSLGGGAGYGMQTPADAPFLNNISSYAFQKATNKRAQTRSEARYNDVTYYDTLVGDPTKEHLLNVSNVFTPRHTAIWHSFAFRLAPGLPRSNIGGGSFQSLWIFHNSSVSGIAGAEDPYVLSLLDGDFLGLTVNYDLQVNLNWEWVSPAPMLRSAAKWHTAVFMTQTDSGTGGANNGDGVAKFWLDGAVALNYAGPLGFSDVPNNNVHHGIYRQQAPETQVIEFANWEESYSDLSARILNPLLVA